MAPKTMSPSTTNVAMISSTVMPTDVLPDIRVNGGWIKCPVFTVGNLMPVDWRQCPA